MGSSSQLVQREERLPFPVEGLARAKALGQDLFEQKGLLRQVAAIFAPPGLAMPTRWPGSSEVITEQQCDLFPGCGLRGCLCPQKDSPVGCRLLWGTKG